MNTESHLGYYGQSNLLEYPCVFSEKCWDFCEVPIKHKCKYKIIKRYTIWWSEVGMAKQYGRLTRSGTRFQPLLPSGNGQKSAQFSTQLKINFTKPGLGGL